VLFYHPPSGTLWYLPGSCVRDVLLQLLHPVSVANMADPEQVPERCILFVHLDTNIHILDTVQIVALWAHIAAFVVYTWVCYNNNVFM